MYIRYNFPQFCKGYLSCGFLRVNVVSCVSVSYFNSLSFFVLLFRYLKKFVVKWKLFQIIFFSLVFVFYFGIVIAEMGVNQRTLRGCVVKELR